MRFVCYKYNFKVYLWENIFQTHLLQTRPCRIFGPVKNIHGDIWSTSKPKGPWYLILSKTSRLRKSSRVQIAHNVYLHFWLTEYIKNTIMFYWSNNCVVAILAITNLVNKSWTKFLNRHFRRDQIWPNIKDFLAWTKCLHGCFGQNKMCTNPDKFLHEFDPYPLERHNLNHTRWY